MKIRAGYGGDPLPDPLNKDWGYFLGYTRLEKQSLERDEKIDEEDLWAWINSRKILADGGQAVE